MLRKRLGYIVLGTVIGSILSLSTGAFAEASKLVSAYLGNHIRFEFNGETKKSSKDKPAIIYKDSVYVPVRFIAEGADIPIRWNPQTQTIEIKSPEPEVIEKIIYKEVQKIDDKEKEKTDDEEKFEDNRDYKTLPIKKTYNDMEITVTTLIKDDQRTKVYFNIKNNQYIPLQLQTRKTTIEVDGEPYSVEDKIYEWDTRWYNDVREGEEGEGYIVFPNIPEDSEGIHINLVILKNNERAEIVEVPFDIEVN